MTAVALTDSPAVACPPWCTVTQEDHLAQLPEWEDQVIHHSDFNADGLAWSTVTYVDGTPDETEPLHVFTDARSDLPIGVPIDEAEALAEAILAAVKEARG